MSTVQLELLVIIYGSNNKRAEVQLRPKLPANSLNGDLRVAHDWSQQFLLDIGNDVKHSADWDCEMCGKPARETLYQCMSWIHLSPPRLNVYVHQVCDCGPKSKCADQVDAMGKVYFPDAPTQPRKAVPKGVEFHLSRSCSECHGESGKDAVQMCSGCKLTRYCSPVCQKAAWPRHKKLCKNVTEVKWAQTPFLI